MYFQLNISLFMNDRQQEKLGLTIPVNRINTALKWVIAINILFLIGTWINHNKLISTDNYTIQVLLLQLNFAKENIAASWYSSMLLFTIGIIAAICFWADMMRSDNTGGRILNFGWIVMAGIFILLSFDEMGSFHEMIGETAVFKKAGDGKSAGWYAFYGLIGVVAIFMITFFLLKFKGNRLAFLLTVIGVILFVSNPFQEKFEIHSYRSSGDMEHWHRPVIFLLLEEGSEIFASFCFLFSFTTYAIAAAPGTDSDGSRTLQLESLLPKNFIVYLVGLAAVLGGLMLVIHHNAWNFKGDDNGIPHNWPPAATSFFASVAAIYCWVKFEKQELREIYLLIACTALITSVYFGANIYNYHVGVFSKLKYVLLALTLAAGAVTLIKFDGIFVKIMIAGWILMISLSVFLLGFLPALAGYLAAASLLLGLFLHYQYTIQQSAKTSKLVLAFQPVCLLI